MKRQNKSLIILSTFLLVVVIDCVFIPNAFGLMLSGYDYEPDQTTVVDKNNSTTGYAGLSGDASFSSLTSNVGYEYYGFHGTNSESWDAFIPDAYNYGDSEITIYPEYTGDLNPSASYSVPKGTTNVHFVPSPNDLHSDAVITPYQWSVQTSYGYSNIYSMGAYIASYYNGEGCGETHTYDPVVYSYLTDGVWCTTNYAVGGLMISDVCYIGIHGRGYVEVTLRDQLNLPSDPNWIVESITFDIGVIGQKTFTPWIRGGHNIDTAFGMYKAGSVYHGFGSSDVIPAQYWEDLLGARYDECHGGVRATRFIKTYTINQRLSTVANSWSGDYPRFYYRIYGFADEGVWGGHAVVDMHITEFKVKYKLKWDGTGDFAKTQNWANKLLSAETYSSYTYPNMSTGIINHLTDLSHASDGDINIRATGDGNMETITTWYNYESYYWKSGASTNDVTLQFYNGISWITLTPLLGVWKINTPNVKSEDWYIAGEGIKFKFKALNYSTGLEGFGFSYSIDYDYVDFFTEAITTNFNGMVNLTQAPGRFIDEFWDTIHFKEFPYVKSATLGLTALTLEYLGVSGYDSDGFPRHNLRDTTTITLNWFGKDSESADIYWITDNDAPTITDYRIILNATEQTPLLVNVTGTGNVTEGWLFVRSQTYSVHSDSAILKPINNGSYQQWNTNDYQFIEYFDSIGIFTNISDANSSYIIDYVDYPKAIDYTISKIELNFLGKVIGNTTENLTLDVKMGDIWLGSKNISIDNSTILRAMEWNGTLGDETGFTDIEINFGTGNLTNNETGIFIDEVYCILWYNYTAWDISVAVQLNNTEINGDEITFYESIIPAYAGNFSYWYMIRDIAGNWATTPLYNLTVQIGIVYIDLLQLDDYEEGTTGNWLAFNITDLNPDTYEVYIDEVLEYTGTWTAPEGKINVSIDGYLSGYHNISIYVNNTLGRYNYYNDTFLVFETPIITIRPLDYQTLGECTGNITYQWIITDDNPNIYEIYRNSTLVATGNWTSGVPISYTVDGCEIGQDHTWIYTLYAQDNHSVVVSDETELWVYAVIPFVYPEEEGSIYEDWDVEFYWEASDHHLVNYSIDYYDKILGKWIVYNFTEFTEIIYLQQCKFLLDGDDFTIPTGFNSTTLVFRCTVYDRNGNSAFDEANITIFIHPPILQDVGDGFYYSDDQNAVLTWSTADDNLLKYWITINTTTGFEIIQQASLFGFNEFEIELNLYELELELGFHEIVIYVEDTYGNIVSDVVLVENRGEQAGVEFNVYGTMAWLIAVGVALFGMYAVRKSDYWERATPVRKTQTYFGIAGLTVAMVIIMSVFGLFPVTFVKLPEWLAGIETALGGYGLLVLVIGVAVAVVGGFFGIRYLLRRRGG